MQSWKKIVEGFLSLFYPKLCLACGTHISSSKESICLSCQYYLPKTNFHQEKENPFTDRFWGRFPLQHGTALYHFSKGGRVQELIYNLKYREKKEIGLQLGKTLGQTLRQSEHYRSVDCIVPVPLHPRRIRQRGYNQSALFANGLAEALEIPTLNHALKRIKSTETQTKKSRLERLANVEQVFEVAKPQSLQQKHILLVDDVLTTGATLEACALKLLEIPNVKVSLATIAIAEQ